MSAAKLRRRRAKVVRLPKPAAPPSPPEHHCPTPYLDTPELGLRLLTMALAGLWHEWPEDLRAELDPLMCLVSDIQDAMKRGE